MKKYLMMLAIVVTTMLLVVGCSKGISEDDGKAAYNVIIHNGEKVIELDIDASTGDILRKDVSES